MFDICIIGSGVMGAAIARELSRYNLKICLIEKNDDVSTGSTKANSGIVHGGYADNPKSIKAKFSTKGNLMYKKLDEELNFGFNQCGSFVIGFDEKDKQKIEELYSFGLINDVPGLEIVDGSFVKNKEPNLNKDIKIALYCPSAGVISPYDFTIALVENAVQNGVDLKLHTEVKTIEQTPDGFVLTTNQDQIKSKIVINAAGLHSDEVARMVGLDNFTIKPRQGQYLLFDKCEGELVNSTIFQTPSAISKGILVTKTYHGNLLIGPDATEILDKNHLDTEAKNIDEIIVAARRTMPNFDLQNVITCFSGNRAIPSTHDFIIGETEIKGFINAAGIESPGLTAAPAIAKHIAEIIDSIKLVKLKPNKNFNPYRDPYKKIINMGENEINQLIKKDADYGCIVCHCETVSHGEIRECMHRGIPVKSFDAIKRRTRASMGRCQGGFCTPKVIEIISKELKIPKEKISKKGGKSFLVKNKTN
jgi:glycerol-3-phosphate dehydrogenase